MNIDRSEFVGWMERIMDRFDLLADQIKQKKTRPNTVDGEELLDNYDLLEMLKISARSLQRYRSSGRLPYYTISGKLYYKHSDVHRFIRESFNAFPRERKKRSQAKEGQ
ncbi:helix-turn-helix domain-containing protein [Sphingobacterium sp.]|uniref:helix-turn-helix domain-containing protein n=1 Tax=Sphingobacterium sp. TaxID=341027 RepID=UPI00258DE318|nr:helix-turn-helix domain-containing protein [Sphingobacterium sp.]WET69105.1 MAG: helix-turn-helix domain-containing protein [Sphingobacterium sp.]